jgi:hypothetical protein
MKIFIEMDTRQAVCETWQLELDDDINLKDFITALEENPSIIFMGDLPEQLSEPLLVDAETYDTMSCSVTRVTIG